MPHCFPWLTKHITAFELRNWKYNTVFLVAEAVLALVLAFTASIPDHRPTYLPVHFGIFATIRSATTLFNFPQYIDAFDIVKQSTWSKLLHNVRVVECAVIIQHPRSFYLARFVSSMPLRLAGSMLLSAILYPVAGLRAGFTHYLVFLLTLMLHSLAGVSTAMMISAICARNAGLSSYIGILALSINIVFAGNLIPPRQVTPVIRWLHFIAFTYFATVAYNQNQYLGGVGGEAFLEERGLNDISMWGAIGVLFGQIAVFNIIGMSALTWHWRRQSKQEKQREPTTEMIQSCSLYT